MSVLAWRGRVARERTAPRSCRPFRHELSALAVAHRVEARQPGAEEVSIFLRAATHIRRLFNPIDRPPDTQQQQVPRPVLADAAIYHSIPLERFNHRQRFPARPRPSINRKFVARANAMMASGPEPTFVSVSVACQ
jgi:hypothetical protein